MSGLRLSLFITFFASNGSTAVFFLVSLVLARLLTPAEIGIFSMTSVLVGIAHVFRDFGVSTYLLQEKELSPAKIRSASGVLITTSWLIGAGMFCASGLVSDYLHQPATREVLQVLAVGFFFIPFGAITHTLLTREYNARAQAAVYFAGTSAYAVSALWLAFSGFSYMSMAWANLINIIATGTAYAAFRPRNAPWMPSFSGWKKVANFGTGSIVGGTLGSINNALPDIWLGKSSGPHDVGLLSRAGGIAGIFMQIAGPTVNYAALPHLAQQHHRGELLRETMYKAIAYLSVAAWPPLVATAIYAHEVVLFLYGTQWLECTPIVVIACAGTCLGIPFNFHSTGLQAIGKPFLAIIPNVASLLTRVVCILVVYDGTLLSFGWALLLAGVVSTPALLLIQERYFAMGLRPFLAALLPSCVVTMVCGGAAWALHAATPTGWPVFVKLLALAFVLAATWLMAVALVRHPVLAELERVGKRFPPLAGALRLIMSLQR